MSLGVLSCLWPFFSEMYWTEVYRSPLSMNNECRGTWEEFVSDAVKVFLGVIQMFGQNPARQREKIVCCIEDFAALQAEVNHRVFKIQSTIGYYAQLAVLRLRCVSSSFELLLFQLQPQDSLFIRANYIFKFIVQFLSVDKC